MGADGGLAFIPVHPKATVEEAYNYLRPFFTFDATGSDWGDDSRSDYLRENDEGHEIVVPYGTDIWEGHLMADEVMQFVGFLEGILNRAQLIGLTFGDVLLERDTSPSWAWETPSQFENKCYQAIERSGMLDANVRSWIDGLSKVLLFQKAYFGGTRVNVWRHETWT
jgi:hypothetical protein